jgi:hypothetical protein
MLQSMRCLRVFLRFTGYVNVIPMASPSIRELPHGRGKTQLPRRVHPSPLLEKPTHTGLVASLPARYSSSTCSTWPSASNPSGRIAVIAWLCRCVVKWPALEKSPHFCANYIVTDFPDEPKACSKIFCRTASHALVNMLFNDCHGRGRCGWYGHLREPSDCDLLYLFLGQSCSDKSPFPYLSANRVCSRCQVVRHFNCPFQRACESCFAQAVLLFVFRR